MLEDILIVGWAKPKNIGQLDQVFKELYKCMNEYEARVSKFGDARATTLPSMIMIMADPATKDHFRKERRTTDLDKMKREVECLRDLYKPSGPTVPLGLSAFGDGKGWTPIGQEPEYTQEECDAWAAQQVAEAVERQQLDAIGKGKGTGKNWQSA